MQTQGTKLRKLQSGAFSRPSEILDPGSFAHPSLCIGWSVLHPLDFVYFRFGKEMWKSSSYMFLQPAKSLYNAAIPTRSRIV
jgi:hypothetical protein